MKIYEEKSIKEFEFWADANDFTKRLREDEWETLEQYFEEVYPEGISDTLLNDMFRFYTEILLEIIDVSEEEFWNR